MEQKPELAVALRYDRDSQIPPYVTAKGRDRIAQQIKLLAEEHGVPVRKDADLVEVLNALDVNTPIPVPLFAAVAEVIASLYNLNAERRAERLGNTSTGTASNHSTTQSRQGDPL